MIHTYVTMSLPLPLARRVYPLMPATSLCVPALPLISNPWEDPKIKVTFGQAFGLMSPLAFYRWRL